MVSLNFSRWDHHGKNFDAIRQTVRCWISRTAALITDLHERGLDKMYPWWCGAKLLHPQKINPCVVVITGRRCEARPLLAGGGLRTGQVIGATNRLGGEHPIERPVDFPRGLGHALSQLGLELASRAGSTCGVVRSIWWMMDESAERSHLEESLAAVLELIPEETYPCLATYAGALPPVAQRLEGRLIIRKSLVQLQPGGF